MNVRALSTASLLAFCVSIAVLAASSVPASAAAPECDQWVFTTALDLEPGFWTAGEHTYSVRVIFAGGSVFTRTHTFTVSTGEPLYPGEVFLRIPGVIHEGQVSGIHPDQDTAFGVVFGTTPNASRAEIVAARAGTTIQFAWDGGDWVTTPNGPVLKLCSWNNPGRFFRDYRPDVSD